MGLNRIDNNSIILNNQADNNIGEEFFTGRAFHEVGNFADFNFNNTTNTTYPTFTKALLTSINPSIISNQGISNYYAISKAEIDILVVYPDSANTGLSFTNKLEFSFIDYSLSGSPTLIGAVSNTKVGSGIGTETFTVTFTNTNINISVSNLSSQPKLIKAFYNIKTTIST